ncbi:MAG: hypothetical protein ABIJ09_17465 [Pseudomonadota bacterium]
MRKHLQLAILASGLVFSLATTGLPEPGEDDAGGGADSGSVNQECTNPVQAPTGSASLTGADFTPVDAVAFVMRRQDLASEAGQVPYMTNLEIKLTDYPGACGVENAGLNVRGAQWFRLALIAPSESEYPALPMPGTYAWSDALPMPWDTYTFRAGWKIWDCNLDCEPCGQLVAGTPSGTLTLTAVSESEVSGSFSFDSGGDGVYSGSFTAPICTSGVPEDERCCWTGE